MTLIRTIGAILAALALAAPSMAAAPPAAPPPVVPEDPQAQVVQDLVVHGRVPGPAWWKVASPVGVVWVLGVPGALPKGLKWDQSVLQRRLTKARVLILPPTASFGPLDLFGAFGLAGKLKTPAPFEATLPPAVSARFLADAAALSQKPGHYDRWKPAIAGLFMVNDFRNRAGLDGNQPLNAIKGVAGRQGVHSHAAATYPGLPMARAITGELSPAVNLACLTDALQEIEAGPNRVRAAAAAWAAGDVQGALTAERGFERCLAALPDGADLVRRTTNDQTLAIARAAKTPGVAVAVVELRSLLSQGGVLDRLRSLGYAVRTPDAE